MNRVRSVAGLVVMLLVTDGGFAGAEGYSPSISAGVRAEQLLYPSGSVFGLQLNGLLGWRSPLGPAGGFMALSAEGELTGYLYERAVFTDSAEVDLLVSLPSGPHRLEAQVGLSSSLLGIPGVSPFLQPDWQLRYVLDRGRRALRPYLAYQGRYRYEPSADEDRLYQGAELGVTQRPSLRLGYRAGLQGGWELWTQQHLLDDAGDSAGEKRRDLVFALVGEAEGLAGYFLRWNLAGSGGLRLSNANRYLDEALPPRLEENSESAWWLQAEGGLGWRPQPRLEIQAGLFGRGDVYLRREALDSGGDPSGRRLQVLSSGLNARADWLLKERLHLVGSGEASWRLSNDPAERRWNGCAGVGLQYSF